MHSTRRHDCPAGVAMLRLTCILHLVRLDSQGLDCTCAAQIELQSMSKVVIVIVVVIVTSGQCKVRRVQALTCTQALGPFEGYMHRSHGCCGCLHLRSSRLAPMLNSMMSHTELEALRWSGPLPPSPPPPAPPPPCPASVHTACVNCMQAPHCSTFTQASKKGIGNSRNDMESTQIKELKWNSK